VGALDGKVALVTGGASGIGRATATRLAAEGAAVAVADLDDERGREAAESVGGAFLRLDVSEPDRWTEAVAEVERGLGGLDVAVLNAGVTSFTPDLDGLDVGLYRRVVGTNLDGVVFGVRATVPALLRRGGGSVVATASLAGMVAFPPDPVYTATKHAVVGLVRSAAPTLASRGIRLDAVCPGMVDTPMLGAAKEMLQSAGFPLIDPAEVADAVMLALTTEGSGRCLVVQPGRPVEEFQFPNVPGPGGLAAGRVPPMPG
jgi:NAD(P)-dependent dehydrogenase (short-subunit alcohol dehydrogenase family)